MPKLVPRNRGLVEDIGFVRVDFFEHRQVT